MNTTALLAVVIAAAWIETSLHAKQLHDHIVEHLNRNTAHLEEIIMSAQQDIVDAVVAKLAHVKGEVIAKLTDLQTQIDNGVPTEQLDLTALTEAAQALDDIVPDPAPAPADAPVE